MPNILSSTSPTGATSQGRPAAGEAVLAPRRGPIEVPFGAHLRPKPDRPITPQHARPTSRGPQPGPEAADDDDKPRFRSGSGATCATGEAVDPLDPLTRALFAPGLRPNALMAAAPAAPPDENVSRASHVSMEHVLARLVRRIAWSGDAETGSARLELGAGALEGATLTIHSDQGKVRVSLELPPGVDQARWKERIARRLGARGLQVTALDVE